MTNREYLNSLPKEEAEKAIKAYSPENYTLYDYIDWKAFFDSDDGNAMHFLRRLSEFEDEMGNKYAILEDNVVIDDMDYVKIYSYKEDQIINMPKSEDGIYNMDSAVYDD